MKLYQLHYTAITLTMTIKPTLYRGTEVFDTATSLLNVIVMYLTG